MSLGTVNRCNGALAFCAQYGETVTKDIVDFFRAAFNQAVEAVKLGLGFR